MAQRVGDGGLATKRVIGVGRFVAERVDGLGDAALRVVDEARCIAAPVGLRDLAAERVVGVGRGDAGGGTRRDGQAAAGDGLGGERRGRGGGRLGRRMGGTVEVGAGDRFVVESVEGVGLGNKDGSFLNKRRGRRFPIICQPRISVVCQPCEAGAGKTDTS